MNKLSKLLPGILIGVVVVLASVALQGKIQGNSAENKATAFLSGLEQAKDKTAFVKGFNFGNGSIISLSNSSANYGDDCDDAQERYDALWEMQSAALDTIENDPNLTNSQKSFRYGQTWEQFRGSFEILEADLVGKCISN